MSLTKLNQSKFMLSVFILVILFNQSFSQTKANLDLSSSKILDIFGRAFSFKNIENHYKLLIFVNPALLAHKNVLVYAQTLYNKYRNSGLEIIAVFPNNSSQMLQIYTNCHITLPALNGENNLLQKMYSINDCCGGVVFIDKKEMIVFNESRLLTEDNLRKLTEKTLTGNITYSFKAYPVAKFLNLNILNNLQLSSLRTNNILYYKQIPKSKIVLNIFSRVCPTCGMDERFEALKKIRKILSQHGDDAEIGLVFPLYVNEKDILSTFGRYLDDYKIYQCNDIFPDDYKYMTEITKKADPFMVYHDKTSETIVIESPEMSYEEFIERIKKTLDK